MGVTTLLSMTVFLQVVADSMPPNSDSVPLIAAYYFGSMLIISLATASTVFTLNIFKRGDDEEPVPNWLQKVFFDIVARILFIKLKADRSLTMSVKEMLNESKKKFFSLNSPDKVNCSKINEIKKESVIQIASTTSNVTNSKLLLRASPFINDNNQRRKKISLNSDNLSAKTLENVENNINNKENQNDDKFYAIASSSDKSNNKHGLRPGSFSPNIFSIDHSVQDSNLNDNERKQFGSVLKSLTKNLDRTELREAITLYKLELKDQWTDLAKVVDTLFLYLFIISTLIMLTIIVSKAPNARFY